jgi:hypothetical protein
MTAAALLLLGALSASAFSAAPPRVDPLDANAADWAARGFRLKDRISAPVDGLPVAAVVYASENGSGDRLEAYVVVESTAYLGFVHPSRTDLLELDTTPAGRGYKDLLNDGSRVIAYHSTIRALNASTLNILRYQKFRFSLVGSFPEGRFVSDGDQTLVLSRELPLGRFLSVGCADFGTISQTAFRTRVFAPTPKGFVDATPEHPKIFEEEIRRKEAALARLKEDLQKNAGEYLGLALSLYYDYSALGRAREGWARQKEFFSVPKHAPGSVKACFDSMRVDLRGRLGVPADWP